MSDPIEYTAKRYRCPHCRRSYAHRATAVKHIARCFLNPAVRGCKTCKFFTRGDEGTECEVGALTSDPCCSSCGELLDQRDGLCPGLHDVKPLYDMRVRCGQWEVQS